MEQIPLEAVLRQMGNRKGIRPSRAGHSGQPAWLHQQGALPDQPSGLLWWGDSIGEQGKDVDVIYLDVCKASHSVPHNILLSLLERDGFDGGLSAGQGIG